MSLSTASSDDKLWVEGVNMILNWKLYLKCPVLSKKKKRCKETKKYVLYARKNKHKNCPRGLAGLSTQSLDINCYKYIQRTRENHI